MPDTDNWTVTGTYTDADGNPQDADFHGAGQAAGVYVRRLIGDGATELDLQINKDAPPESP